MSFLVEREDQLHCFLWLCQIQGVFRTKCTLGKTCWSPKSSTGMSTCAMKWIVSSAIKHGRVPLEEPALAGGWVVQRDFSLWGLDPKPPGDLHAFLLFLKPQLWQGADCWYCPRCWYEDCVWAVEEYLLTRISYFLSFPFFSFPYL